MSDQSDQFDAIVIGSGIGGLAAALTLAQGDKRVLVLEAGKQLGGYLNPFKRGRYEFDPGLHYIGECGPGQAFERMLSDLGLQDGIRFRELSPDAIDRIELPGYAVAMPRGADAFRERLVRDFPRERAGLDKFFSLLARFHDGVRFALHGPTLARLPGALRFAPSLLRYGRATYGALLADHVKDPILRSVLAAQGGDIGLPPSRSSALIAMGVLDHYLSGAYFPVGGSRALRDLFASRIQALGGVLKRSRPVSRILIESGRAAGVACANGERYRAGVVISNADAARTYRDLIGPEHLPKRVLDRASRVRPSLASLCLFLGTDIDLRAAGMTDANIWHYGAVNQDEFYDPMLERGEMPEKDFFFLSSPTLKDPESNHGAPAGKFTLEFVTLCPFEPFARWEGTATMKRGDAYLEYKQALAERYLKAIERYVPGVRAHIEVCEVATPLTNISFAAAPRGAIYGPDHAPDQIGPFRFAPRGAVEGLYLCGSSVGGGGIVPSGLSGHSAGRLALRALRVQRAAQRAFVGLRALRTLRTKAQP
jgi:all-trans-retinol 13,14-reductase